MPRILSGISLEILISIKEGPAKIDKIYSLFEKEPRKKIYDTLFRLTKQELVSLEDGHYALLPAGTILLSSLAPEKDGVWKIIIFDIPETQRPVRNFLRAKLKSLGFKLWQNSIWISPYALAPEIEAELNELANHYFVRLIKTTNINYDSDLIKMFE